ncbi:hypothetical protein Rhopal_006776-T1 [Rhodotorula paludigena]|uniref:F-box domain-containing protein n=1 Tax=Rhodotorula paludigena TaxID=86838 RepID=A0AAV5GUV2_9BASI|nr:hypothetical protein Rhopal_006776-T1 [Rhodotorula paludigena]
MSYGASPAASNGFVGSPGVGSSPGLGRKDRKGKAREGYGASFISLLPLEILAHVFAHLPPHALGTCQLVCRAWHDVVVDEGSWRTAFETYYSVEPKSLGRRLEPSSWRLEYIARVSLLRQWHRTRTSTVTHNPSLGAIHYLHINLPAASTTAPVPSTLRATPRTDAPSLTACPMLSLSLDLGAAVHSAPFTGGVSKRPLLASPIDHLGRPLGLPLLAATSFALSHDGTRLVWGMRDGSLRFVNSSSTLASGGRGVPGGAIEQGEVRSLDAGAAHREGSKVQKVAFSNAGGTGGGKVLKGIRQRPEVFASAGSDGAVAIWSLAVPPVAGARDRAPPAVKLWQGRWDIAIDAPTTPAAAELAAMRPRVKATALAFDSGWLGRSNGRPASIAVGRSDGKVVVWPAVSLEESSLASGASNLAEATVLSASAGNAVDTLELDPAADASSALSLLVHQADASTFSRFVFASPDAPPIRTTCGHSSPELLSALTSFAVDFDEPPPLHSSSNPATPAEGRITFPPRPVDLTPSNSSTSIPQLPPALSRSMSHSSISPLNPVQHELGSRFGRRKYVAAGDKDGRVFLWDWEERQSEEEHDRGDVVLPAAQIQGLEIEGGGSASKVTALELTEAGLFVGSLDGTLRFYSTLGNTHLVQSPIRSFRDRSAPRHPARALAQGLVPQDEEDRWLVSHIRANRDAVVAAIGGRVLAWRIGSEIKKKSAKPNGGKITARQERFKANMELQHQVRESISALSAESQARLERFEEQQRFATEFGLPPSLDNMTEEEAVAFALMLSVDDQEAQLFSRSENGAARDDGDWEQVPEDWLDGDELVLDEDLEHSRASDSTAIVAPGRDFDDVDHHALTTSRGASRSQSLSTSLTISSSPFMRGASLTSGSPSPSSRNVAYTWKPVSPSLHAIGSPPHAFNPNGKIHVSPRLGPTYGSTAASLSNDPVPDMSPELWPTAAASSPPPSSSPLTSRRTSTAVATSSPSPLGGTFAIAASGDTSPAALPSPPSAALSTPIKRGWSDVARSASSTPVSNSGTSSPAQHALATSPSAWPSPPTQPLARPQPGSLLAEQLRQSQASAQEDEARRRRAQEEEDLRYAMELSLAEEASRLEI